MKSLTSSMALIALLCNPGHAAERPLAFSLWVTDQIGATSGEHCAKPQNLQDVAPVLTEMEIASFDEQAHQWRFLARHPEAPQWTDHCFVLVTGGQLPVRGLLLSSHSARGGEMPALYLDIRRQVLKLTPQTRGYHASGQ